MIHSPRGTRDILGLEFLQKEFFLNTFKDICLHYGFSGIETPIFESTQIFQRTLGETSDVVGKEMYIFNDRGNESMTLRPEGTAPVIRALISNGLTQTLPQKFFYSGPMFRYERPQKGRYRQFHQACIEYIGSSHPIADAEVISLGYLLLQKLNIPDVFLNINTLGDIESRHAYKEALVQFLEPYKNDLSFDSQERLKKNPLRILDSKDQNDQKICENAPLFSNFLNDHSKKFYEEVLKNLELLNIPFQENKKIVRGLDYYTHTAFEFKTTKLGAQDAVIAGGRYDHLVQQMGGPEIPAVGFGMGIERICLLMQEEKFSFKPVVGILPIGESDYHQALQLAYQLRRNNIACELPLKGNLNKRFKQLERYNCQQAIVFGSDEWNKGCIKIKNLHETDPLKKEQIVLLDDLMKYFRANI